MLIFGIDTCCMAATAALMDETRLIAQTVISHSQTHSQKMMPQIEAMLAQAEVSPRDIDCFAAAVGPGSFTGVRIGVATAKALAQAWDKPCAAVSTLAALAWNVSVFQGLICPILDARREQVYNALFRVHADRVHADRVHAERVHERVCEDRALGIGELLDELEGREEPVIFCGDGVPVFREVIVRRLGSRAVFAPRALAMNLGASAAELGLLMYQRGETVPYGQLVPQYVRLSQAERERLERNGQGPK